MTLFTLAGALISASHVCCVALLSAYQQTTSAALHNRSFEGFLFLEKKGDRKSEDNNNKKKGKNRGENTSVQTHTNTYNCRCKPTQMDMIAGLFSLCLSSLLCSLAFLSLGLIRLLVEMEAIGEDSWANDESVCAVIALIKRAVLLAARERKERAWQWKALGLFFAPSASSPWKEHLLWSEGFVNWDDF